ncbi:transposase [Oceanirhabdus sp. W0125-5]|uniref:transposase n=1 Tax=Oceanirhabdus sp. W0125-5 TaxID=2999116 RepID=UPI0022F30B09|nr:transposase [Oceanirhabdus sp. W0125-5]WBW99094.1 transposase [Oceanirhabdus sp. W0125-5]
MIIIEVINMPRKARQKSYNAIYHIMARSITEVDLYKDNEDKEVYLSYIKKYQKLYRFKVYAYCLMDNHVHIMIDANGSDISRVMHGINSSYVRYFNKKHKRHGHLFQDRFKSKMVLDNKYLCALSLYIHNNPIDIPKYKDSPEKYYFSSLAVYFGERKDPFGLIQDWFLMSFFGDTLRRARKKYSRLIFKYENKKVEEKINFKHEETEYRSGRNTLVRNFKPEDIIEFIASKLKISELNIHLKHRREYIEAKAIIVLLMRSLCNYRCTDICNVLGNISQVRVSELSSLGIKLMDNKKYKEIVEEFIECYSV